MIPQLVMEETHIKTHVKLGSASELSNGASRYPKGQGSFDKVHSYYRTIDALAHNLHSVLSVACRKEACSNAGGSEGSLPSNRMAVSITIFEDF